MREKGVFYGAFDLPLSHKTFPMMRGFLLLQLVAGQAHCPRKANSKMEDVCFIASP